MKSAIQLYREREARRKREKRARQRKELADNVLAFVRSRGGQVLIAEIAKHFGLSHKMVGRVTKPEYGLARQVTTETKWVHWVLTTED